MPHREHSWCRSMVLYCTVLFRCFYSCVHLLDYCKGQEIQNCLHLALQPRWKQSNKSQREKANHFLLQSDPKQTFIYRRKSNTFTEQPQLQSSIVIPTHYPWRLKGTEKPDTWWRGRSERVSVKKKRLRYLECRQLCHALLCWTPDENRAALDYQSTTLGKGCRWWMSLISTEWEINASLKYLSATQAEQQLCYASLKAF